MRTHSVVVDGVRLEVAEAGRGGRPFLLVHGFTGTKQDFTGGEPSLGFPDVLDELAALGWHAVAPDLRGHGRSDHPSGEAAYDFPLFVGDLVGLAGELGWERFVLLGHSMGGMIAQHLALEHPGRVSALVLMDTGHGAPEGFDASELEAGVALAREHGMQALLQAMLAREDLLASPSHRRLLAGRRGYSEFCDRKFLAASADMWTSMVRKLLHQPDRLDALRTVAAPTLVIVGEQDRPFIAPSERMAKTIPGARVEVIPGAGHSPQFEAPDAWWPALTAFLGSL